MMETLTPIKQDTPNTTASPPPPPSLTKKVDSVSATECANCGTTTTPLWRRGPNGETICNACGLYLKARNTLRPPTLKRTVHKKAVNSAEQKSDCGGGTCPGGGQCNGTGGSTSCAGCPAFNQHQVNRQALICANCRTTTTPLWRRDEQGNTICNACGLYYKLHNVHRPVSMKRSVIKRRKRIIVAQGSDEEELDDEDDTLSQTSSMSTSQPPSRPPLPASSLSYPSNPPNNAHQQHRKMTHPVPEIEDYVVLKKKKLMELPKKKQQHYLLSSPPAHPTPLRATPMSPPPLPSSSSSQPYTHTPVTISAVNASSSAPTSLSDKIHPQQQSYHQQHSPSPQPPPPQQQQNKSPLFSKPYPESQSTTKSFLPPISLERQSYRLESLFGRRDSASSATSSVNTNNTLPPLSLPPLTPPSSQPQQQQHSHHQPQRSMSPIQMSQQQPSPPHQLLQQQQLPPPPQQQHHLHQNNGYELADFDQALDRLEHLRRQVRPEQSYALSQLTQSLSDLASKAEAILSLDSLAYGR
ncbi:uncharacterized protein ATC70_007239 [Mucor velutinosus]|uniref:GATA-type domain-containing protein n=1 Tax=Mucor velutinosus TaxID=708070 RepID=A0AAN7D676_9FUNG|nr:hypothetical protein ATC70_007239 [Mucor velutinosus]